MPMTTLRTLDDYRQAISMAANSKDLELLINRALPTLYAEMGIPYPGHTRVSVATKLSRNDDNWALWFNIEAPKAIAALSYLAPHIFDRMSGGANQASSITKGAYGHGFLVETCPFALEDTFHVKQQQSAMRLNQATSIGSWWSIFYEALPWALAKTRGWTEPTASQWTFAKTNVEQFKTLHGARVESSFLLRGGLTKDMKANARAEWSNSATSFSDRLERNFYPLLNHFPGMTLDSSAVHSFNIKDFSIQELSHALCERAKPIVWAHCALTDTSSMPAYLLVQALMNESTAEMHSELPAGLQMEIPSSF